MALWQKIVAPKSKILVLNAGSSSLKSSLFVCENGTPKDDWEPIWQASVDWSHAEKPELKLESKGKTTKSPLPEASFPAAADAVLKSLWEGSQAVVASPDEIALVGHRTVHGGSQYIESTVVTDKVLADLRKLIELAPEHEPANIEAMEIARRMFAKARHIAVFDTAFHATMPECKRVYPGPFSWYTDHGIRRFGFHGISHQYAAQKAADLVGKNLASQRIISCHLGGGASLCAIKDGESQMNTMGFTPLEGLMMGSRSGSVDPGLLLHLIRQGIYTAEELAETLNRKSGLKGISGVTSDMREIERLAAGGHNQAKLAFDIYIDRLSAQIASLLPTLSGLDLLLFTGGIGQNSARVRAAACKNLAFAGVRLDESKNQACSGDTEISANDASVRVFAITCREDIAIARQVLQLS